MLKDWIIGYHDAQQEDRDPKHLGLSQAGKCPRQLAYRYHLVPGEKLLWRSKSIFSDGNWIQDQLRGWIHEAPTRPDCYYLADEEGEVTLTTPRGRSIQGHTDGVVHHDQQYGPCPEEHRSYLLEIKSMSSTGWRAFKWEGLEASYVAQVSCYLKALDLQQALILIKNKDTSDLMEIPLGRNDLLVEQCLANLDAVIDSEVPDRVQRKYQPNEEGELPWQCRYCSYWVTCWKDLQPKYDGKKLILQGDYRGYGGA